MGLRCPKNHKNYNLPAFSQGWRPGLLSFAPSGLRAFFHTFSVLSFQLSAPSPFGAERLLNAAPKLRILPPSPPWGRSGTAGRRGPHVLRVGVRGFQGQQRTVYSKESLSEQHWV